MKADIAFLCLPMTRQEGLLEGADTCLSILQPPDSKGWTYGIRKSQDSESRSDIRIKRSAMPAALFLVAVGGEWSPHSESQLSPFRLPVIPAAENDDWEYEREKTEPLEPRCGLGQNLTSLKCKNLAYEAPVSVLSLRTFLRNGGYGFHKAGHKQQ